MPTMFSSPVLSANHTILKTFKVGHGQEPRAPGPFKHLQMDFIQTHFALNQKYVPFIMHLFSGRIEVFPYQRAMPITWAEEKVAWCCFLTREILTYLSNDRDIYFTSTVIKLYCYIKASLSSPSTSPQEQERICSKTKINKLLKNPCTPTTETAISFQMCMINPFWAPHNFSLFCRMKLS